jgi:hypothetical protein
VITGASKLGKATLWVTVAAAVAFLVMLIAGLMGIEGAREGEEGPAIFMVLWVTFLVGGILAFVLGVASVITGLRHGRDRDRTIGIIGVVFVPLAWLLIMVVN